MHVRSLLRCGDAPGLMNRSTFLWLFGKQRRFNRFLVRQFNERLAQFIALVEHDGCWTAWRAWRVVAWLFNPCSIRVGPSLEITQEEVGH